MAYPSGLLYDPNEDYGASEESLKRQRARADALYKQGQGLLAPQEVGGRYVAPGWLGALSQLAQGGMAMGNNMVLDSQQKELSARKQADTDAWMKGMPQDQAAVEAQPARTVTTDGQVEEVSPATEAKAAKPVSIRDALEWAMRGERLGTMPASVGKDLLLRAMPKAGDIKYETAHDEKGRPVKYIVNNGQRIGVLGGSGATQAELKARALSDATGIPYEEAIKRVINPDPEVVRTGQIMAKQFGISPEKGLTLASHLINTVSAGENVYMTNPVDFLRGGGGGGGVSPQQGTAAAPMIPRGAAAAQDAAPAAADPTGSPFAPPRTVPGVNQVIGGNATAKKLADATDSYAKELTTAGIPEMEKALGDIEGTLKKYKQGDIPVGGLHNLMPEMFIKEEFKPFRASQKFFENIKMVAEAGKARTPTEIAAVKEVLASTPLSSEAGYRTAVAAARRYLEAKKEGMATHPEVLQEYQRRINAARANALGGGSGTRTDEEAAAMANEILNRGR